MRECRCPPPGTRAAGEAQAPRAAGRAGLLWVHLCPGQQSLLSVLGSAHGPSVPGAGESPRAEPRCLPASGTWDTRGKWGDRQEVPALPLRLPPALVAMVPPGDQLLQPSFPPLPEQRGADTQTLRGWEPGRQGCGVETGTAWRPAADGQD